MLPQRKHNREMDRPQQHDPLLDRDVAQALSVGGAGDAVDHHGIGAGWISREGGVHVHALMIPLCA